MKKITSNLPGLISLIFLLISLLTPLWPSSIKLHSQPIFRLINGFIIAYLAYLLSFMETRKVFLFFLPLIINCLLIVFIINQGKVRLNKTLVYDSYHVLVNLFDLISLVGLYFLIDLLLTKIFGSKFTGYLGLLLILSFFLFDYISKLASFSRYRELLLYLGIFIMATRVKRARSIRPYLYILGLVILMGEVFLSLYFKINLGFLLGFFPLVYILLKSLGFDDNYSLVNVLILSYLYLFPSILILTKALLLAREIPILIIGLLATYIVGEVLYRLRLKFLNYPLIGIN
ncbi:MAG: hypothetical protein Q4D88_00770 [Anaerococcus sp.]|nr:hypothetical protein [Anaerococcus sp.]